MSEVKMDNNKVRRDILEILYKMFKENPYSFVSREVLLYVIYNSKGLDSNIAYLEEKGYVELQRALGTQFIGARIKAGGVDLIEDESEFNVKFPIKQNITQIKGDVIGVISQGNNAQITSRISIQIGKNFNNILEEIDLRRDLDTETKQSLRSKVQEIQTEIQKSEPNAIKVKSALDFLKNKAKWVYDKIVTNPVIAAILVEIAKSYFFGG